MNKPKISVIVTYANCEHKIKDCIESILNQNFKDFELICVNNASSDGSENIVMELTKDCPNVKRISLPNSTDENSARNSALTIATGDYVCFVEAFRVLDLDFLSTLVLDNFNVKNEAMAVVYGELYRREFLENSKVLNKIVENKVISCFEPLKSDYEDYKKVLKEEIDNYSKSNVENINNKNYELWNRFAQLEKTVHEKDAGFWAGIENSANNLKYSQEALGAQIYADITKIYEHISEQINQKGAEIGKVYEEITNNYGYTEDIVNKAKEELYNHQNSREEALNQRLYALEKEIIVRYVNIKRLFDMQIDEINAKLDGNYSSEGFDIPKAVSENIEKIYAQLNKTNAQFYEELTRIYQDLNDKLLNKMNEQQYQFDCKINELTNRIQALEEKSGI